MKKEDKLDSCLIKQRFVLRLGLSTFISKGSFAEHASMHCVLKMHSSFLGSVYILKEGVKADLGFAHKSAGKNPARGNMNVGLSTTFKMNWEIVQNSINRS